MDRSKTFLDHLPLKTYRRIQSFCNGGFNKGKILLFGDYMLDHYVYGCVERISPEAPVPVVKFQEEKFVPGGAGNVIANLVGLGISVCALGRLGTDIYGKKLKDIFDDMGVDTSYLYNLGNTTLKTRIIGDKRQQMLRLDNDIIVSPSEKEIGNIETNLIKMIQKERISCLLISDYAKGFCSDELCVRSIKICRENNIPVFIDPKKNNWNSYSGAFLITPNIKELSSAAGNFVVNEDDEIEKNAKAVISKYEIDNILVTRSEMGASLISKSSVEHERASAVEVYDVSGAGDTMISAVAAFFTSGAEISESVRIANLASQIVVGKLGTYPIKKEDLMDFADQSVTCQTTEKDVHSRKVRTKSANFTQAEEICKKLKEMGKKIVFTNGCFDILHAGHVKLLAKAKGFGDYLIVGLNSDESVKRLKGNDRPINDQESRIKLLEAMEAVDLVVLFDQDTPEELIKLTGPDVLVKGGDYRKEDVVGAGFVKSVVIVPLEKGFSTTGIINKIGCDEDK